MLLMSNSRIELWPLLHYYMPSRQTYQFHQVPNTKTSRKSPKKWQWKKDPPTGTIVTFAYVTPPYNSNFSFNSKTNLSRRRRKEWGWHIPTPPPKSWHGSLKRKKKKRQNKIMKFFTEDWGKVPTTGATMAPKQSNHNKINNLEQTKNKHHCSNSSSSFPFSSSCSS